MRSVFALGVWCFSGFTALFPIIVAALYWRRLTAAGAISGIFAAIISWCVLFYYGLQVPVEAGGLGNFTLHWSFGGEPFEVMPVVVMLLSSTATTLLVSLVTPQPKAETLAKFF